MRHRPTYTVSQVLTISSQQKHEVDEYVFDAVEENEKMTKIYVNKFPK